MNNHILFGRQLMFDEFTNRIVEEPIKYWQTMDDVPCHIKGFILNTTSSRVIYDVNTSEYHCSRCLKKLDEHYYCQNCANQCIIPISNESKYVINTNIKTIKEYEEDTRYFVFDLVDGQVLLYIFLVDTSYYNHLLYMPHQINKISLEEVYHVTQDGIINLLTGYFASFKEYDRSFVSDDFDDELLNVFESQSVNYLYTANLTSLQYISLYKYTFIWDLKNYFDQDNFNLLSLTYYPLHFKQFEYLVKMKLYRLAATEPYMIEYKQNFKDTFGVEKQYYSLMKDIDVDISQLLALRLCPTTDIALINFIARNTYVFEELAKYVKANKIKTYLEKQNLDYHHIYEYYDYIRCCAHMSLNMKDKRILFPQDLIKQHNKIISEMIIIADPKINERIRSLSNILVLNKYEDEKYIIFPADSVDSLIDESTQQSNCVRNYCMAVSNNECQIYFMRHKDTMNKSLVTIEVRDGKIVQARTRFNALPTAEMNEVLKRWEQKIIPITNL